MKKLMTSRDVCMGLLLLFLLGSCACMPYQASAEAVEIQGFENKTVLIAMGDDYSEDEDEESCSIEDDDNAVPPPPGMEDDNVCEEEEASE